MTKYGILTAALALVVSVGCASSGGRSTTDARVRSFAGSAPPELAADGTWIGASTPASLAGLRGRVVYLQHAFPT